MAKAKRVYDTSCLDDDDDIISDAFKNAIVPTADYDRKDPELNHMVETLTSVQGLVAKAEEYLSQPVVSYDAVSITLATAYKHAPNRDIKIAVSEANKMAKKCRTLSKRIEDRRIAMREKGMKKKEINLKLDPIKEQLEDTHDTVLKYIETAKSGMEKEGFRLDGSYAFRLKDKFSVKLADFNKTNQAVVLDKAPILIGVKRPISLKAIEKSEYGIEHLESFLYLFKEARVVGFLPTAVPKSMEPSDLKKAAARCGYDVDIAPMRMSHPTSKRVWFLVLEFPLIQRSCQFADKSASPEFEAFRAVSNSSSYDEVNSALLTMRFPDNLRKDILTRWAAADNSRTRNSILMTAMLDKRRRDTQESLRKQREAFMASKSEEINTLRLLKDDYHTYAERLEELSNRFGLLTADDADPLVGLTIREYPKLNALFERLIAFAVRGEKDGFVRRKSKEALEADRLEARIIYYEYVAIKKYQKRVLATIKSIEQRISDEKELTRKGDL